MTQIVQHGSAHNPVWALTTQPTSYVKPWKRVLFSNNSWYCLLSLIIKSHEVNTEHTDLFIFNAPPAHVRSWPLQHGLRVPSTKLSLFAHKRSRICQIQTVPNKSSSFLEIPFFRGGKGWKLHDRVVSSCSGIYLSRISWLYLINTVHNSLLNGK